MRDFKPQLPDSDISASAWFVQLDGPPGLLAGCRHASSSARAAASLPLYDLIKNEDALDAIALSLPPRPRAQVRCRFARSVIFPGPCPDAVHEASYFIIERVLHNSVNVMTRQRDELGIKEYPLYSHDELDRIAPLFQGFKYNREIEWVAFDKPRAGSTPTLEFYDAGHALGSLGLMVRARRKQTLFYTGDISLRDQTILKGARFEDVKADVLIMETTRGNRNLPEGFTRESELERLTQAIERVLKRKGCILIPTFSALGTHPGNSSCCSRC